MEPDIDDSDLPELISDPESDSDSDLEAGNSNWDNDLDEEDEGKYIEAVYRQFPETRRTKKPSDTHPKSKKPHKNVDKELAAQFSYLEPRGIACFLRRHRT